MADQAAPKTKLQPAASILELPPELLLTIIDYVLYKAQKSEYYNILYRLMLVCSPWSNLIKSTPTRWSLIDKAYPRRLPLVLQRSQHAPLTIESYRMGVHPTFDKALFDESYRWESAVIEQGVRDHEGSLHNQLRKTSMPMLKTFRLIGGTATWSKPLSNLFVNDAPKLEELRLVRCDVPFESPLFDNLRTLELATFLHKSTPPTPLFDMLRRCSRLTTLVLTHLSFGAMVGGGTAPIELPNLIYFHIHHLKKTLTTKLIAAVRIPLCTRIFIRDFSGDTVEDIPTSKSMPHLVTTFASILKVATRIILAVEGDAFRFTTYSASKERTFEFCGESHRGVEALEIAATQWGLADRGSKVRLEVRVHVEGGNIDPLLNAFRALPGITTILLHCLDGCHVDEILDFLGEPYYDVKDGVDRWYCPNLENFLTDGCGGAGGSTDNFMNFLEDRYEGEGEHPRRLKYMHITIPDDSNIYKKKELRPLYNYLQPDGMLSWTPGVPKFNWGIGDDDEEDADVSTDLEGDPVRHWSFEAEFDWSEDDSEVDSDDSEDKGEEEGESDAEDDD